MAETILGEAKGFLYLDTSSFTSALKSAVTDLGGFEDKSEWTWDKVGKFAAGAGAAIMGSVATAATAFTAFATQSVKAYADYEQLVGGVETLFGKSADIVQNYAESAYKTANLSANQYMETVTSFSASLLQGLGGDTEKAAEIANLAVTDMADNANKMGTSIESIQNAYQGFAKDNYTMLDNLKLGYGGTASEMARLVNDSGVLGDSFKATAENVKDIPFDQLVLAIHEVQTEMGITGTTALEASETISGSWNTLTSSWTNVLTSLASGNKQFFDESITALVSSTDSFVDNVMGAVTYVIEGSAKLASGLISEVPEMLQKFLPAILQGAESLLNSLISELPSIMGVLVDVLPMVAESILTMLPSILEAGIEVLTELGNGISESLPTLIPIAVDAVLTLVDTLIDNADELIDAAVEIIMALGDGLVAEIQKQEFWDKIAQIVIKVVSLLIEYAPKLIVAASELINKLIEGLLSEESIAALSEAAGAIGDWIYQGIVKFAKDFWAVGNELSRKIAEGMKEGKPYLTALGDTLTDLTSAKANESAINNARDTGKKLGQAVGDGISESVNVIDKLFGDARSRGEENLNKLIEKTDEAYKKILEEQAKAEEEARKKEENAKREVEKSNKAFYDNEILKIKDYRNQIEYSIEGEIAKWETLASKLDEKSKERIDAETKVRELRKKLADQQAKDVKDALKSEEDAIKSREKAEKDYYGNAKLLIEDYKNSKNYAIEGEIAMQEELLKHFEGDLEKRVEIQKNINKLNEQLLKDKEKASREAYANEKNRIENLKYFNEISLSEQLADWEEFYKTMDKNTEQSLAVEKEIYSLRKQLEKDLQKDLSDALKARNTSTLEIEQHHLDREIEAVKTATDEKIKEYQREYDEKIKLIDEASQAEIDALQAQLDALTEQDQADKSYENAKKLIELNQAIAKAALGDGDLKKAMEAYDKEVKRQQDEKIAAEKKAQIEILKAQIEGVKEAAKQKEQLMKDEQDRVAKARDEEIAYYQKVADMEVEIASTKNEQLKQLLQEDLDEYIRVHDEKAALVKGDNAYFQFDKTIEQLEKQLGEAKTDAEKARLQKQLDELNGFKAEFFQNVTLAEQQAEALILQAQEEINFQKKKELRKLQYAEMNETENLEAQARLLMIQGNEDAVIEVLSKYNDKWKQQGKDQISNMTKGTEEAIPELQTAVETMATTVSKSFEGAWQNLPTNLGNFIDEIKNKISSLKDTAKDVTTTVPNMFNTMTTTVTAKWTEMWSGLKQKATQCITNIITDIQSIQKTAQDTRDNIVNMVKNTMDHILTVYEDYREKWRESGVSMGEALLQGINFQQFIDKAEETAAEIARIMAEVGGSSGGGEQLVYLGDGKWGTEADWESQKGRNLHDSLTTGSSKNTGAGDTYVTINSPEPVDGVEAAQVWEDQAKKNSVQKA